MQTQPQHIGIIMDGNRRWAKKHGLEVLRGHEHAAKKTIEPLVDHCIVNKIPYLTLWAFSTENWKRSKIEVRGLMQLFREAFTYNAQRLHEKGVRLHVIGDVTKFPEDIQENIAKWLETTKDNTKIVVTLALNYGGRDELLRAIQLLLKTSLTKKTFPDPLTEKDISQLLDTADMPDPDLIIRTGGEQRLSGFMPWQTVYSELYFTATLMPDFNEKKLDEALTEFQSRQRRFGA